MRKLKKIGNRIFADLKEYGWAVVVFFGYYILVHLFRAVFCPLIHLTGIPCAGCGLTRAFLHMIKGEFVEALYINPMAYLVVVFAVYCGFWRYIRGTRIRGFSVWFGVLIVIMLVFYLYRMYLYFPDRVPYVYTADNLLANRLPGYKGVIAKGIALLREIR